jgi:hypothetical protein
MDASATSHLCHRIPQHIGAKANTHRAAHTAHEVCTNEAHLNDVSLLFALPNGPVHVAVLLLQQRRVLRVGQVALIVGVVIVTVVGVVTSLRCIHNITQVEQTIQYAVHQSSGQEERLRTRTKKTPRRSRAPHFS